MQPVEGGPVRLVARLATAGDLVAELAAADPDAPLYVEVDADGAPADLDLVDVTPGAVTLRVNVSHCPGCVCE
jgi:hypothetical protein